MEKNPFHCESPNSYSKRVEYLPSSALPVERSLQDHWSLAPEDRSLPKNKQNQYFLDTLLTG